MQRRTLVIASTATVVVVSCIIILIVVLGGGRGAAAPTPGTWAVTTDMRSRGDPVQNAADYWRPLRYAGDGGKCAETACRTGSSANSGCPPNFELVGCEGDVAGQCKNAGRRAGCVPCNANAIAVDNKCVVRERG